MHAIGTDEQGCEVLVGLTLEETAFCMEHTRRPLSTDLEMDGVNKKRYAELMKKHEVARLRLISAEVELRNKKRGP